MFLYIRYTGYLCTKLWVGCLVVICWERAYLLGSLVCFVFLCLCHFPICVLNVIRTKGGVGTVKHVKALKWIILLNVPRRCFFCGSFLLFMFYVCLYYTILSVPCSLFVTCWERADPLALLCVMFSCVLSLSHMVSRARFGTWLYWFLVFAFFLTSIWFSQT